MRWQVPVVLAAVAIGTAGGLLLDLGDAPEVLVVPALVGLLTLTFAGVDGRRFAADIAAHRRVAGVSLVLNFVWAPLLAGTLGWALLGGQPDLRLGLVMLLVTPCTDWYLVFTGTARGNVALAAALLPPNLVLQLALLPVFVVVLAGTAVDVPVDDLVRSVAVVLGIPVVLASIARRAADRTGALDRFSQAVDRAQPIGVGLLAVAIAAIFATHAQVGVDDPAAFARLLAPLAVFFAVAHLLAALASRTFGFARPERVTLTMTTMARNSPVALAIAASVFPDRPLVAVALVVGPLVELPVLAFAAQRLRGREGDVQEISPVS